jgi:mannose-6-phosphate isomerase
LLSALPEQPVRLKAQFHEKVWGSKRVEPWCAVPAAPLGEVWWTAEPRLPLLPKLLFTEDRLSVQVHPDDRQARARGLMNGKSEMWHVLRADAGAVIGLGFKRTLTKEEAREAALSGAIEELMEWIPVAAGDSIYAPAGTVHALGAGLVICEIQQNSDTTYRLYDYGRPRELHLEEALSVADLGPARYRPESAGVVKDGELKKLVSSPYFVTELLVTSREVLLAGPRNPYRLLVVLEGGGVIQGQPYRAGECWYLPAEAGEVRIDPLVASRFLRTGPPVRRGR